jgi:NAD(P)-dependent dehydrogenase (short-subunit alcohol dehydrogenase family)
MKDLFDLTGRTAVVTGGGGILGQAFCKVLSAYGANVAVADIDLASAERTVAGITADDPQAKLLPVQCDVSSPEEVADLVSRVTQNFGDIHILHNNAAGKSADLDAFFAPFEDYSLDQWRAIMSVNLEGMFLVAQAVGKRMVAQGTGGSIIQTASIYGVVAPDMRIYEGSYYLQRQISSPAVYSASKAGVIGLTRYLATYWADKGIRVNALSPGGVESGQNDAFKQRYSERVPMGRMAQRSEMQGALLFLASDASTYVTGQNIVVDGGLTAW